MTANGKIDIAVSHTYLSALSGTLIAGKTRLATWIATHAATM